MSYINFESSRVKDMERNEKRKARDAILDKAEAEYNYRKQKEEQARLRGDDKWILPSIEGRIKEESRKGKKQKHKKKKSKKTKRRKSSSSDSESKSDSEDEWVEKVVEKKTDSSAVKSKRISIPERDQWMTLPGLFPTVTRDQLKQQSGRLSKAEEEKQKNKYMLDKLGQTDRELNPYWKDGGTGLPQEKEEVQRKNDSRTLSEKAVGDYGVDWLRRAMKRTKEQAEEEGRTMEEVAAERWGSLKTLETLLAEAEGRCKIGARRKDYSTNKEEIYKDGSREQWRSRGMDRSRDWDRCKDKDRNRERERDTDKDRRSKRDSSRDRTRNRERDRSRDREIVNVRDRNRIREEERNEDRRKDCHIDGSESLIRPRTNYDDVSSMNTVRNMSKLFQKPKEGNEISKRFQKPGENDEFPLRTYRNSSSSGNWRKKLPDIPLKDNKLSSKDGDYQKSQSSSSDSEDEVEKKKPTDTQMPTILTDKEMNELGAKLVKAEILGNEELARELKSKLEAARIARTMKPAEVKKTEESQKEETVILTKTDSKGFVRPLQQTEHIEPTGGRRKKQKVDTHKDGQRVRYFADDDKHSLQELFEREKLSTVQDQNELFSKLAGNSKLDDMEDIFEEQARLKESSGKMQARERNQAIREHKKVDRALENCNWCFDSKQMLKHLIAAIGTKIFKKTITAMFQKLDQDVVFFESAMYLNKFPHMLIECVPMPRETGDLAPIYFKKAILECETEWATNKKLVDLHGKDVRRAIPKGLPYFTVDFGLDPGFAHVIEDQKIFPRNFAQEIIGGMLDLDHNLWRKPRRENFDVQRKKVVQFAKWWEPFDFTVRKEKSSSDSDSD
ncbi:CWF19-like protein 2 [Blattella germanica]|nr:CWF19-like protein 2 [Blattella germanica]